MARPYTSLLLSMLSRAADHGIERETFVQQYMLHYEQLYKFRHTDECAVETFDILYFLVEKDCWGFFWPNEPFPGLDPRHTYESQLQAMMQKARAEGMSEQGFDEMWMECFEAAVKEEGMGNFVRIGKGGVMNGTVGGMEIVQFEAERRFWGRRWGEAHGAFGGLDPRISGRGLEDAVEE